MTDFDRRDVLRALTALGVTGVTASLLGGTAEAAGTDPLSLKFSVTEQFRPFALIAPKFVQVDTAARPGALVKTGVRPKAPYGTVTVDVLDAGAPVVAGLAGNGVSVLGTYDPAAGQAGIEITTASGTAVVKTAAAALPGAFGFAVVINENAVTVLADTGTGWRPLLTARDQVRARIDLRDPAVLGGLGYAYGSR
ncbi:twin-arginine translocation signal domain-containing protein, partial [Amycolatopsis sp. SID8362]|uniref:twin-arginine translocation signal domain-containing protein n=1 Tax=Amycolatopsis sp. SID8362 TaxID=2690346 RepID=UPI0013698AA4